MIDARGIEQIKAYVKDLPYGVKRVALWAIASYMVGDDKHGYRHYPPLGGQAYLKKSPPGYVRTNKLKEGWTVNNDAYNPKITNSVPYAPYVPRWKKYGWREWIQVAKDNMAGAIRHANAKVKDYLKRKG
jgi:hypothetical protein